MKQTWAFVIFEKIVETLLSLLLLLTVAFFLLHSLPGGPFDNEQALSPLVKIKLEQAWGLHESIVVQYFSYVTKVVQGDFGFSISKNLSVGEVIQNALVQTYALNLISLVLVLFLGFAISLWAVIKGGKIQILIEAIVLLFISLPSLFIGPVLIWFFAFYLNWLPVALLESPLHFILPVVTLSVRPLAQLVRVLSDSLQEALHSDYMRTARAKGLPFDRAVIFHALRNSLVPVLSYSTPLIVGLISGTFIVEVIFSIHGLGFEFTEALANRDYPLSIGITLYFGILVSLISAILNLMLKYFDPRLRESA